MKTALKRMISLALALCMCLAVLPAVSIPSNALTPTYTVSSSYKASSFYTALCNVTLTGNQRDDIINVALSQVGYNEGNYSGDYAGEDDGYYNNYTEYNYWYNNYINSGMPVGGSYAPWCATFVSWCAEQAQVPTSILQRSTAAGHSSSYFYVKFYAGGSTLNASRDDTDLFMGYNYTPQKGDLFFTRTWSHVGLVVGVNGDYVTTVEGNTNSGGSAEGEGVFVRSRYIDDLYFGVPDYESAEHTCEQWDFVENEAAHPHYSRYECPVCGEQKVDTDSTNFDNTCVICQQPETPVMINMYTNYADSGKVMFEWSSTKNTTHYNLILEVKNSQAAWEPYEQVPYAASGMEKSLPVGEYRCMVQSYNNGCWMEDGSDWLHADSDYSYFTVSRSYYTITYDANGGFTPVVSQTVLTGGTIGQLPEPQRNGYQFIGWFPSISGNDAPILPTTAIHSDMTLYARWDNVVTPTLTLNYPTLSFEDEIRYNIYFTVDDTTSIVEMGLAVYAYRNSGGTVDNAVEIIPGYIRGSNGAFIVSSDGVPAKQLSDTMYFKAYAKLSNGNYAYSNIAGYNAVAYAGAVLNDASASSQAKALMVAMLNYGAAAQVQFGYKTDSLMNASLTAAQKALVKSYDASMVDDVTSVNSSKVGVFVHNGGYSRIYPSVSFEGAFATNYYFVPKYTPSVAPTFYYWDAQTYARASVLTVANATGKFSMTQSGSEWIGTVSDIAAKGIDQTYYVAAVYTVGGTTYYSPVIAYSLGAYCEEQANLGNNFGAATAVYGYYAKAYFA